MTQSEEITATEVLRRHAGVNEKIADFIDVDPPKSPKLSGGPSMPDILEAARVLMLHTVERAVRTQAVISAVVNVYRGKK